MHAKKAVPSKEVLILQAVAQLVIVLDLAV